MFVRKYHFITVVLLFFVVSLGAQDIKIGLRAGLNIPNITAGGKNTPVSEGYKSRLAAGGGVFTEMQLSELFSIRFGVEYSGQGGKKNGMQAMPSQRMITGMATAMGMSVTEDMMALLYQVAGNMPQYYYLDVDNKTKFDYVMIPVLGQWTMGLGKSPWSIYVNAGPFVSFLVSGKQIIKGTDYMYTDDTGNVKVWDVFPDELKVTLNEKLPSLVQTMENPLPDGSTNITGEMKSTNFGVTGNIGIKYECGNNTFFLEGGGNYGLITVQKDSQNGKNRLGTASVMLGYAFSFF